ncbi:hypothetical protein QC764_501490 [Podospora pseudoanserina]|uniref:Inositol monophosphatase n=1 Tax=Podospora pseudoanserina TaxID=2609844 RepID=A0ABR0I4L2_9PEZI|nr:hypothetical protein QC764_501490 [Podospora pseudoanserina]
MHISPPPPPPLLLPLEDTTLINHHHQNNSTHNLTHELLIASLAIQRASLLTKRVLQTLTSNNNNPPSPTTCPSTPVTGHPFFPSTTTCLNPSYDPSSRRLSIAKPDASPVTIADFASQALLISTIHHHFPSDTFIGEEDSSSLRHNPDLCSQVFDLVSTTYLSDPAAEALLGPRPGSIPEMLGLIDLGCGRGTRGKRCWSMDPIDGTSAFLKGEQYAVSLALLDGEGRELMGLLGCPNLGIGVVVGGGRIEESEVDREGWGVMLSAVRGEGCALVRSMGQAGLNKVVKRINRRKAKQREIRTEELHFVDSRVSCATDSGMVEQLARRAGAGRTGERTEIYSSHMRYAAMVLGGREFVQVRFPKRPRGEAAPWCVWDHAGSQLIYTESGAGKVTDLEGRPIDFGTGRKLTNNWGLITADESVHGKMLELAGEVLKEAGR